MAQSGYAGYQKRHASALGFSFRLRLLNLILIRYYVVIRYVSYREIDMLFVIYVRLLFLYQAGINPLVNIPWFIGFCIDTYSSNLFVFLAAFLGGNSNNILLLRSVPVYVGPYLRVIGRKKYILVSL